jgi:hypothetical protein
MRAFIKEFKNDFNSFLPEDIAFPRSCNNIKTYSDEVTIYKKSTPIAVRGSLLYNNLLKTKKMGTHITIIEAFTVSAVTLIVGLIIITIIDELKSK